MASLSQQISTEFKKINKPRTFSLLAFLGILVILPLITSTVQKQQETRGRAQTTIPGNVPAGTAAFEVYGSAYVGDTLASGWGAKTWYGTGTSVDLIVTNPVYEGTHAISYKATAPADTLEFFTETPLNIAPYTYLNFYARGAQPGLRFAVTLLGPRDANGNHKPIGQQLTMEQYGGVPPTDRWFVYGFPLASFNAGTTQIYGFGIMDLNGGGAQLPLYLDEIAFSAKRATETSPSPQVGPPGSPTVTLTPVPPYFPEISPWLFIIPGMIVFLAIFFE
jgi:hypothetical protein